MVKPNKSFRIDPRLIEKADKLGLPIVDIFEAALAATLKDESCPYCGQEYKPKKVNKLNKPSDSSK